MDDAQEQSGGRTEPKQAESERERLLLELEESRRLFRRIAETSPDSIHVYDLDAGRSVYASARSEQVIGYTADEVTALGNRFAVTLWHPDDLSTLPEHRRRLHSLADDEIYETEYRLKQPDGTYRWLRSRAGVFVRNDDGQVRQIVTITQDATARKQAEEVLQQAHEELERRVAERTGQLTAANTALRQGIAQREQAEVESTRLKDELAADLEAMNNLYELSTRLLSAGSLISLLEEVLSATINMLQADFGNIQLYNRRTQALEIAAQRGFEQEFLDYFNRVEEGTASCGAALQQRERVIVQDVLADPLFAPHRPIVAAAGYRAVQSTPLFSRSGKPLGVLSTHFRQPHRPSERELRLTDLYARQAIEMIERELAEEQLQAEIGERRQAEQARQHLLGLLVSAQEEERRRVAHELHDSLGQYLTALDLGLKATQALDGCLVPVADSIQKLRELALKIDDEVERLVFELRPPALDDLGLAEALRWHVQQWSAANGITVDLHTRGLDHERLPPFVETTLYRIVQEALTNVHKHAAATRVSLIVERRYDEALAIIEDDGGGFDLAAAQRAPRRLGLRGMVERAELAGGRLDVESTPGAGTTLYVHIPLLDRTATGDG